MLKSEFDTTFLPDHLKSLIENGLNGISNYQKMLNSMAELHKTQRLNQT